MKMKILAIASIMTLMTLAVISGSAFAVKGPVMDNLQFKFYGGQSALWTGLVNNEIDMMAWPLTYTQYQDAKANPDIIVAPYYDLGDYELAINNNYSLPDLPYRSPTNYTEFRQAIACLVDKDGLISGPTLNGFATRIDTQIPRPILNEWVNYNVSKYGPKGELLNNYPWDYNPAKAAQILDAAGFVQGHTSNPYYDPSLPWSSPTIRVYPQGHEKAGQDLDPLIVYIRSDHAPRKALGEQVANDLKKIGIPVTITEGTSGELYDPVYAQRKYHLYTAGWSLGRFPLWFYSFYNPIGIYEEGPNFYQINDHDVTPWTEKVYPKATSYEESKQAAMMCQYYQVMKAYLVPVYSSASYYAYRKGFVYVPATAGYGLTTGLDFVFLATYHQNYPSVNTIRYGTMNPPVKINPLFSTWLWDYEVVDRIFTGYMNGNPYKMTPGKSPAGGDLPWMAYDWKWEIDPADGNATVTLWFRHDIKWHDGVPFTVEDLNETIELGKYYDDSWGYSDFVHVIGFTKIDDYTCKIHFDMPSIWALYTCNYDIVPKHIYGFNSGKHHPYPNDYKTGPHGEWPWKGDPVTPVSDPAEVWVGTGMWKYVQGSYVKGIGGGILLTYNPDFWMSIVPGDIDFAYYWTAGAPPQGGSYKIGLSDLVLLANAYGTSGTGEVPFKIPGEKGAWNPGADLAAPSGIIGLSDLVTLAKNYGKTWGTNP
jgi:ABC-type transport system substrate-binding protein